MKTYTAKSGRTSYHARLDVLYASFADGALECCDAIEDTPSGVIVMRSIDGGVTGVEIPEFSSRAAGFPAHIEVDASVPFLVDVECALAFPDKR